MTQPTPEDSASHYVSRTALLQTRGWGRLQIEQHLGAPDVQMLGEDYYLLKYVLFREKQATPADLAPDPAETAFTELIDQLDIHIQRISPHELFHYGLFMGIAYQGMVSAGLTTDLEGLGLEEKAREALLDKLLFSYTNYTELARLLRVKGLFGKQAQYYLTVRVKRLLLAAYPWISAAGSPHSG